MRHASFSTKLVFLCLVGALLMPEVSLASGASDKINGPLSQLLSLATGPVAKTIATLAIAGAGYATYLGKISIEGMVKICVATGIIFGSTALMDVFVGAA